MARLAGQQPIRRKLFGSTKLGDRGKGSELHFLELELTRTKDSIIPVLSGIEEIQLNTQQVTIKNFRSSPAWMPALSVLEITHNRSAPTRSRAPFVAVKNTKFSCASQKSLKRIPKLIFIHMPSQQVMRHKELTFPFTQSNKQRRVSGKTVTIFCDGGPNTTYITH